MGKIFQIKLSNGRQVEMNTGPSREGEASTSGVPQEHTPATIVNIYGGVNTIAPNAQCAIQNSHTEEQ